MSGLLREKFDALSELIDKQPGNDSLVEALAALDDAVEQELDEVREELEELKEEKDRNEDDALHERLLEAAGYSVPRSSWWRPLDIPLFRSW